MKRLICLFTILLCSIAFSQTNTDELSLKLDEMSVQKKGINQLIKTEVSGLTLYDFITSIAKEHQLNLSVDGELNEIVAYNFFDVTVKDVLIFITNKHDLEVTIANNIITFKKRKEEKIEIKKTPKVIDISYNEKNNFLSLKLENDSLVNVAQIISDKSGKSIVLSPEVKNQKVSSYILNRPFEQVLDMMAKSNNLLISKDENEFYFIDKSSLSDSNQQNNKGVNKGKTAKSNVNGTGYYLVELSENGYLNIKANAAEAGELIAEAAEKLKINYFLYNKPENEKTTLNVESITFDDLLEHIFKGKKYTFKREKDFYLIGEHITEGLRATEIIQLENRSIEAVLVSLPKVFYEKLEIKEFVELNGLVVSGSKSVVDELRVYIKQIDKVVPLVQIEVIIVQYNKSYSIQTGLKSGLNKDTPKPLTQGVFTPKTDINLNGDSVNSLIDAFNGLGFIKLGKVTESFYLNLQLLEDNSVIKIESTPKLSTISGHEAKLAIGETNYYFEQTNQLINNGINDNILQSGTWKSTDANLSVSIKPFVSTDENVTLNIVVEKSSFLGRAGENAPPGKATQKFESLVRVKNNEMVLLGGLDELEKEDSGSGLPFIARVPVIKWFFSNRTKSKSTSKLHIFIKPSVIY